MGHLNRYLDLDVSLIVVSPFCYWVRHLFHLWSTALHHTDTRLANLNKTIGNANVTQDILVSFQMVYQLIHHFERAKKKQHSRY